MGRTVMQRIVGGATLALLVSGVAQAQLDIEGTPSISMNDAPLISPTDAITVYNSQVDNPGPRNGLTGEAASTVRDPRLERLADSLGNDRWRIYEYVRNAIDVTPQFGLQKGAFGAMLDGYGTPFDQAHLMVELLREAGYSASYVLGEIQFDTPAEIAVFTDWLGPATGYEACTMLASGGIPAIINGSTEVDCSQYLTVPNWVNPNSLTSVRMLHVWVEADLGNGTRAYDPSLGEHVRTHRRDDILDTLPNAAFYRTETGGSIGTYSGIPAITGLSATSVTDLDVALDDASQGLLTLLETPANMNQSLVEIVGGTRIDEAHLFHRDLDDAGTTHPYEAAETATYAGDLPIVLRARVTIDLALRIGGTPPDPVVFDLADLAGRRIVLAPSANGAIAMAHLFIDEEEVLLAQFTACVTCHATGFGTNVGFSFDHPYAVGDGVYMDEVWRQPLSDISSTVFVISAGDRGRGAELRNANAYGIEGQVVRAPFTTGTTSQCLESETQALINNGGGGTATVILKIEHREPHPTNPSESWTWDEFTVSIGDYAPSPSGVSVGGCYPTFESTEQIVMNSAQTRTKMRMAESWAARAEELLRVADGVAHGRHVTHHALIVATSRADVANDNSIREDQALLSVTGRYSHTPLSYSTFSGGMSQFHIGDTTRAYLQAISAGLSALESAVVQEATGAVEANSTASMFRWYLTESATNSTWLGSTREFLLLDDSNFSTGMGSVHELPAPAQVYGDLLTQAEFSLIIPRSGRLGPSVDSLQLVGNTSAENEGVGQTSYWRRMGGAYLAFDTAGSGAQEMLHMTVAACSTPRAFARQSQSCLLLPLKGSGGATFSDAINGPQAEQDYLGEQYDAWASAFSVDVGSGSMTFTPPADIETGAGGYPYSLAFQRTYNSGSQAHGPLGTGWSHNYQARLEVGSDIAAATGGTAQQASATIVALDAILSLFEGGGDEVDMVRATLIQGWWAQSLVNNAVTIQRGSGSERFYLIPGGDYISSPGAQSTLAQTGTITIDTEVGDYSEQDNENWLDLAFIHQRAFDYSGLGFTYTSGDGVVEVFGYRPDVTQSSGTLPQLDGQSVGSFNTFLLNSTSFPTGVTVTYTYNSTTHVLESVSNGITLGRQLNFTYVSTNPPGPSEPQTAGEASHGPAYLLASVSDENSRVVSFATGSGADFNKVQLNTVTDPENNTHHYGYSAQPIWTANTTQYGWSSIATRPDELLLLSTVRLPHQASTEDYFDFGYDEFGRLLTVTDADGDMTTYGIGEGARGMVRDPAGVPAWSWFDQDGNPIASENRRNTLTTSVFDGIGRLTAQYTNWVSYPDTYFWSGMEQDYDAYNNVIAARTLARPSYPDIPSTYPDLEVETHYNHPGQPTWPTRQVDARGNVAEIICYSSATNETGCASLGLDTNTRGGLPQAVLGAEGETTIIEYDALGLPTRTRTQVTSTEWRITEVTYADGLPTLSRIVNTTSGAGLLYGGAHIDTQFEWTDEGDLSRVVDPTGADVTAVYDDNRRIESMTVLPNNPALRQYSAFNYNASGWLTSTAVSVTGQASDPMLTTAVTYTPAGQVESILDPDDASGTAEPGQSFAYDVRGWLSTLTDGAGHVTHYNYYSSGEQVCTRSGFGTADQRTTYLIYPWPWGGIGNLYQSNADRDSDCAILDAGEDAGQYTWMTWWSVDPYLRNYNTVYPHGHWDYLNFDENSNATMRRRFTPDGLGNNVERWRHTSVYDQSNRLTSVTTPEGTVTTTYNLAGEPTLISQPSADWVGYEYDFAGRVLAETRHNSHNTRYEYDLAGRRTAIIWNDGYTARYVYNARGDLIRVEEDDDGNGVSELTLAEYDYDRLGRLTEEHLGGYDPHGSGTRPGSAATSGVAYTYEDDGELVEEYHLFSGQSVTFSYDYDGAGRLTAEHADTSGWLWSTSVPETWTYSHTGSVRAGDPTNVQNQYDTVVQTSSAGTATYTLSYDHSDNLASDGTRFFNHDTRNRLTGVTGGGVTASYYYDVLGRRNWRVPSSGAAWIGYIHAGDMEIAEINGAGQYLVRYVPGLGTDRRVTMIVNDTSGNAIDRIYYHTNRLGNVIATATAAGALADQYIYTPFGVEVAAQTTGNPFRYTGRRYDPETYLYYYRARYYLAPLGRFIETDPIGYADQMNLYAYVGNNPLNATDPSGMRQDIGGVGLEHMVRAMQISDRDGISYEDAWMQATEVDRQIAPYVIGAGFVVVGGLVCIAGGCEAVLLYTAARATVIAGPRATLAAAELSVALASEGGIPPVRLTVPGAVNSSAGKVEYLLGLIARSSPQYNASVGKGRFFGETLGFTQRTMGPGIIRHFRENRGSGIINARGHLEITGPMTGPNGRTANVTSVWQRDGDDAFRFVTAMPAARE